ncbi:aminotransferase class I/II-fold pyridoxal phosphate-dependent enzyme [Promicromonospora sp. NPDC052451]|uniref:aminotransferase class I/II-fold pyridoxal phosphate-dependent enzyme n=1 Tax=unclassified Promicromonospora TaxID=2647929 RepID=UPI0037CA7C44
MDHSRVPVLEALQEFRRRGDVVFGPPAHGQGRGADPRVVGVVGEGVFTSDVLMLNGLDDRRQSQGVLSQAQELMADAVGAEHAFFSTCGSSLSVKSAMISVAGPGEKLLVSRNAHKSVIAALIISGIDPVWVHPHFDDHLHLAHPPEPDDVRAALEEHPDAKGMLLISPTDWGTCADIAGAASVCHEYDVPLLVDEAWGAHLPFHDDLPAWGMHAGADLVVTSVHKMGGAIEQSSTFHLQGGRIDPTVLQAREDLLGTTSSSSLVYATLDGWRRQMVEQGRDLLGGALERAARLRSAVDGLEGLEVMGREVVRPGGAADLDPLAVTIDVRPLGITGYQAGEWLRARCQIDAGSTDACRIGVRLTHAHGDAEVQRLVDALTLLPREAPTLERPPRVALPPGPSFEVETAMSPRDAFFGPVEQVPITEAVGRVAAEMVSPYPPGVPVLAPGEVVGAEAVEYLTTGVAAGMLVPDAADPELTSLRVVAR